LISRTKFNIFSRSALIASITLFLIVVKIIGQETRINDISIYGLTRTSKDIVIRDLFIQKGDRILIREIPETIKENQWQLLNTGIYADVEIIPTLLKQDSSEISFIIYIQEAWFIYPTPYLEIVDRNFNVWWKDYKHDLSRINLGTKIFINNLTGHRDRLDILVHWGYHDKYEAEYSLPYINKSNNLGIQLSGLWSNTKELGYNTDNNNKQERFLSEHELLKRLKLGISLIYQPKIRSKQRLKIELRNYQIDSTIYSSLNKSFLYSTNNKLIYPVFSYDFQFDRRNIKPHPTVGYAIYASIEKQGINSLRNALLTVFELKNYLQIFPKITLAQNFRTQINWITGIPDYYHNRALGEGDYYIRGYEYYLIDGQKYAYIKTSLQWLIHEGKWNLNKMMPIEALKKPPIQIYFTLNNDLGYVAQARGFNKGQFNDKLIWGGGIGLEILAYYDKMIQLEYSFNQLFENDVFLHLNLNF